ncbi:hypothetical protein [Nocardioides sp.]|uniref:hypothetical protein n=1 Tax=Nocardioides sp. TaxID=35761 RepID=UPI002D804E40|nr:hypothetical protein [Nocardioides sp.]
MIVAAYCCMGACGGATSVSSEGHIQIIAASVTTANGTITAQSIRGVRSSTSAGRE